jgi:L-threonylcarbamoyladenylate synthase
MIRGTDVDHAAAIVRAGGLVAFPTETVYGLGADATSDRACAKIFAAKGRPAGHPLIVHLPAGAALDDWAIDVSAAARALAAACWPGPLTLIVPRGPRIAATATGGAPTVGLRIPAHPIALALLAAAGVPIAAPSANRFGRLSPTSAEHVAHDLGDALDYLLDGGPCEVGVESTIIDCSVDPPTLLRPGGVPRGVIEEILGAPLATPIASATPAPGTLASHYAPRARVIAVNPAELAVTAREAAARGPVAVLAVAAVLAAAGPLPDGAVLAALPDDPRAAARALYAALRGLDDAGVATIVAALPDDNDVGEAIADRLRRAAGPREEEP